MDKKLFLYAALAFVSFALWSAWQKDYNQPINQEISINANKSIATKAIEQKYSPVKSELELKAAPETRLLKVRTDVLDVAIDTLGGNVVRAGLLSYPETLNEAVAEQLFTDDPKNLYVATSSLISPIGPDSIKQPAQYKTEQTEYVLPPGQKQVLATLYWDNGHGLQVEKTFTFSQGKYDIAVDYKIRNNSNADWRGVFDAQLKRGGNLEVKHGMFQFSTFSGASIYSPEKAYEKISYEDLRKKDLNREISGGWLALQQRYFLSAWIPAKTEAVRYYSNVNDKIYTLGFTDNTISVSPKSELIVGGTLYVGPEVTENLKPIAKGLDLTVDYGWLWMISMALLWLLKNINAVVGNWGWSIVLVTIIIKLVFFKLSESSYRSMAKMKDLAPKMQAIKERYGDDKEQVNRATMDLYKKEKLNPLGGCLPLLIQIPFFIALYYMLSAAVELRQAHFIFWLHDLASKDPYYVLPVLMGISMLIQQKLSPTSPDPVQAKMMLLMPVMFTGFFLSFPAGLVLYWLVNNCLSILQQWYITERLHSGKAK